MSRALRSKWLMEGLHVRSFAIESRSSLRGRYTEERKIDILGDLLELQRAGKIPRLWCNSPGGFRIGVIEYQSGPPDGAGTIPRARLSWDQAERIAEGAEFWLVVSGRRCAA